MAASDARRKKQGRRLTWRSFFRILLGALKWTVTLGVLGASYGYWTSGSSSPMERVTALLVFVLFAASVAYLLYVPSRVRLSVPGFDASAKPSKDEAMGEGGEEATRSLKGILANLRKSKQQDAAIETIQVWRSGSKATGVVVANDSYLPVLYAKTAFTIEAEPEGDATPDEGAAQLVMGDAFSVPARGSRGVAVSNSFVHVGIFMMRSAGVRIWDLIRLCSRVCGPQGQWRVRVVPNVYRLRGGIPWERRMSQDSLGIPDVPADALDYDRVRDYEPGDPIKTIHWKVVAHSQGELYTKLFETATTSSVTLLVDPYGPEVRPATSDAASHMFDTMLEGGFSLIEHARQTGIQGRLRFVNRKGSLVESGWKGMATLGWFVETARRPSSLQHAADQGIAALRSLRDGNAGYVVFATSRLSDRSVRELIACHHGGVPLMVVHALPPQPAERDQQQVLDARLREASINVIALMDGYQIVREVAAS